MQTTKRRKGAIVSFLAVAATAATVAVAQPASALGAREVFRGCGSNMISSSSSAVAGQASTQKWSGSCTDRLSVAWSASGVNGARVYGSTTWAFTSRAYPITGGMHWGCDSCGVSHT